LTWHEIACRCLWWECVTLHEVYGYMLFLLISTMCRSYAHERDFFLWKMPHFDQGYVTCLHVPFYLVGNACPQIVAIFIVHVSILACYSALCIFEKHMCMLAFVDLIHALPTRRTKVPNSCFQGEFCIKWRKIGRNAFVQRELAFMH
jgi:hypothetical protein